MELTGTEQEKIKGNLYELDYLQHFREVIEKSIPADNYTLIYEHGELLSLIHILPQNGKTI